MVRVGECVEKKIRPLLAANCYRCHGSEKQEAGLRLDYQFTRRSGGASGPAIVAGKPEESLLVKALRYDNEDLQMPPDGKLADEQIALLTQWIVSGAEAPSDRTPVDTPGIGCDSAEYFDSTGCHPGILATSLKTVNRV